VIDTHTHIHDDNFKLDAEQSLKDAAAVGVDKIICVGTDGIFSKQAIDFAARHDNVWASVGLHPHDADVSSSDMSEIAKLAKDDNVVAIGECGLDYFYDNSPRELQKRVLIQHLEIAKKNDLPVIFHIRGKEPDSSDAYNDFWEIYNHYRPRGVVHSFSAHAPQLSQILDSKLLVGVNGIVTFAKPGPQLDAYKNIPLERMVLETDAPLLTPVPYRGNINESKYIPIIVKFLADLRSEKTSEIEEHTSINAAKLFGIGANRIDV